MSETILSMESATYDTGTMEEGEMELFGGIKKEEPLSGLRGKIGG